MLLYRARSSVKVGQLQRYIITYIPAADNVFPPPKTLYLRLRNNEMLPLRAAYLNGPFMLNVDVKPAHYDPFLDTLNPCDRPAYDAQVKAAQSFYTELRMDPERSEHSWTIDVVSQMIFSSSAKVSFELSIGRDRESLGMDSDPGIFSNGFTVINHDTAAIWSSPKPDLEKPVHLVVLSHGLHSNTGADMLFLKEQIDKACSSSGENVIVRGYFDNVCRTERGIKYLGKRMATHIATSLRTPEVKQISFIGHSLGGLVMTYAIAYIHAHYPDFFKEIEPINFITLASPLLGLSNENPLYVKFALDFGFVGKSGQDLGLTWKPTPPFVAPLTGSKPLLRILPTGPAAEILHRFKRRTVYANAVNDGIVPLRTSALLYLDWRALSKAKQAQSGKEVANTDSDSQTSLSQTQKDAEDRASHGGDTTGEIQEDTGPLSPSAEAPSSSSAFAETLRPIQTALSFLKPPPVKRRPSKIYGRSQTISTDDSVEDDDSETKILPKTSVLESATSLINPPTPPDSFLVDVKSRPKTIFHDRIYYPEDLPHKHLSSHRRQTFHTLEKSNKSSSTFDLESHHTDLSSSVDKRNTTEEGNSAEHREKAMVEEKLARAWHDGVPWRKVLVQLEPDAHNNIIVRRTFANAYGWPVVDHLIEHHFRNPYDSELSRPKRIERLQADMKAMDDGSRNGSFSAKDGTTSYDMQSHSTDEVGGDRPAGHNMPSPTLTMMSTATIDSVQWDESAFELSESDSEDEGPTVDVSDASSAPDQSYGTDEQTVVADGNGYLQNFMPTGVANYFADWAPMKLYSELVASVSAASISSSPTSPGGTQEYSPLQTEDVQVSNEADEVTDESGEDDEGNTQRRRVQVNIFPETTEAVENELRQAMTTRLSVAST
ncbi:putative serine esterase-domain-containing protein [Lipomyces oligophaga]|uniref:putative serine esterase-domain-containing protein n=1 Tax=Lipomyces oligophaga TaxID=45792 RepID=UPI0034CD9BBE